MPCVDSADNAWSQRLLVFLPPSTPFLCSKGELCHWGWLFESSKEEIQPQHCPSERGLSGRMLAFECPWCRNEAPVNRGSLLKIEEVERNWGRQNLALFLEYFLAAFPVSGLPLVVIPPVCRLHCLPLAPLSFCPRGCGPPQEPPPQSSLLHTIIDLFPVSMGAGGGGLDIPIISNNPFKAIPNKVTPEEILAIYCVFVSTAPAQLPPPSFSQARSCTQICPLKFTEGLNRARGLPPESFAFQGKLLGV